MSGTEFATYIPKTPWQYGYIEQEMMPDYPVKTHFMHVDLLP